MFSILYIAIVKCNIRYEIIANLSSPTFSQFNILLGKKKGLVTFNRWVAFKLMLGVNE